MVRFDAYTATTTAARFEDVIGLASQHLRGGDSTAIRSGYHGFDHKWAVKTAEGSEAIGVLWGGRQGQRVMVEVKGERTPAVVDTLRQKVEDHRCTRVDSCADFDDPEAWQRNLRYAMAVKREFGLKGERRGDWDDYPEEGRTQMLGSPSSAVQARLYEKGKQPEYRHLERFNWVRWEVQVRPVKDARTSYSALSALDVWGASRWTRELAARALEAHVGAMGTGAVWRPSERDRALAWMCKQYGPHLVSLMHDLGNWDCVGLTLGEMVKEQQQRRIKSH